ncbi:MAG TPA: FAD-binding oxidoreductase, partial [Verrucomicrobiae bacterium]|nr:FAD-binding oxidoreductase [Verrucomicrobiae bacterium]
YADREMFSLVMLFDQKFEPGAEEMMAGTARLIIAAALRHHGRFYLPYRLHATLEQFREAYPQASAFFELKRKYDPGEVFQNAFYERYGKHPAK